MAKSRVAPPVPRAQVIPISAGVLTLDTARRAIAQLESRLADVEKRVTALENP